MVLRSAAMKTVIGIVALGVIGLLAACDEDPGTGSGPNLSLDAGAIEVPDASTGTVDAGCSGCGEIAASLGGLRWEIPCTSDAGGTGCAAVDPATKTVTLSGETGATYDVTLRFRGVVEPQIYTAVAAGPLATGTNGGFFAPNATYTSNGKNMYRLEISAPAFTGYLNYEAAGHTFNELEAYSFKIDYTVTIPITSGATVSLSASAVDGAQYKNVDANGQAIIIPDVPPAPAAYDGQFVQMDVVTIAKR